MYDVVYATCNNNNNMSLITTPDTKKKKIALPSVLSNIRNAVGRAGVEENSGKSEVEIRPLLGSNLNRSSNDLVGVGKSSSSAANRAQMRDRSTAPSSSGVPPPPLSSSTAASPLFGSRQTLPTRNVSASVNNWSATLQTYSERIGSQWRKRNRRDSNNNERRRRRGGVTINTQPFLIVVGFLFIGFPILLMLFLLARKAVFGDEGVDNLAKHEVPAHEVLNYGIDNTGVSPGITEAQVLNDLKQLTSEDNPLGSFENDAETISVEEEGSDNEATINEVNVNQAVLTNEANINGDNEVARESETMDNKSNLRGSKEEENPILPDKDHDKVSSDVIDKGVDITSSVENENKPAPVIDSEQTVIDFEQKTIVDSSVEKEITNEDSLADEKVANSDKVENSGNIATEHIIVQEDEKSMTNNEQ